jgi:hypothetical protein
MAAGTLEARLSNLEELCIIIIIIMGLLEIEWAILRVQMGGSMQERTLRRRYSSSFRPYARR